MTTTKKITIAAVMMAMGILLPLCFHMIPNGGSIFAPMHLPTIMTGFICGPFYGAIIGLLCPLLSFLFMGMPMIAVLPAMMIELFFYGLCSGVFFRVIHTRRLVIDVYLTLILTMIIGRIFGGLTNYLLFIFGRIDNRYSLEKFFSAYFVVSWPAWLIQLTLIPSMIISLSKTRFVKEIDRSLLFKTGPSDNEKQIQYFDTLAPLWGKERAFSDEKLETIFSKIHIAKGMRILDVGCGSGVIDNYLLKKGAIVDALDISPKMIEEARKKKENACVNYIVSDFYAYQGNNYDALIVFDAYPHFKNPRKFATHAKKCLKKGASLWIVFDASKETINECHTGTPQGISRHLLSPLEEARHFASFDVHYYEEGQNYYYLELIRH